MIHIAPSYRAFAGGMVAGVLGVAFLAALGPGLFITALNVKYRDFRYVIPFLLQFGLYVSPVGFSSTVIREKLGDNLFLLYSLNPMVGVIEGFNWAMLHDSYLQAGPLIVSTLATFAILIGGLYYFRRMEKTFADVV